MALEDYQHGFIHSFIYLKAYFSSLLFFSFSGFWVIPGSAHKMYKGMQDDRNFPQMSTPTI